jgi:DNA-binding transcriptional MocR family regulator
MDEDGLRPDALEAACRGGGARALYCLPTIQNPTATVVPPARRREIAHIAREHGLALVEDDIHALLPQPPLAPISSYAPEISYYVTSTSKLLAPGLRVGYLAAPPGTADRMAAAIRATTWMAAPLLAEIASVWIRDGTADRVLDGRRDEAKARQEMARATLAGTRYRAHPCGYHIWLELESPWTSEAFAAHALHRGVAVTPADVFAVGHGPPPSGVRVCLGGPRSRGELEKGLRLLLEAFEASPERGASGIL